MKRPASLICSFKTCTVCIFSVLWNPSGDGSQVVTVCEQHLELWDLDRTASTAEVCLHLTKELSLFTVQCDYFYHPLNVSRSLAAFHLSYLQSRTAQRIIRLKLT